MIKLQNKQMMKKINNKQMKLKVNKSIQGKFRKNDIISILVIVIIKT